MNRLIFTVLIGLSPAISFAQQHMLSKGCSYHAATEAIVSDGDHAPFWLTANRHGIASIQPNSAYLKVGLSRDALADKDKNWTVGMGADFVVAAEHTSTFFVQQLYADLRYKKGLLSIGQKEHPMQLKNNELSSGSQTFGINARPYPEIRLSLPEYWNVPGTRQFLGFKGHIAFGMYTDNRFQRDFVKGHNSYDQDVLMHTKAGYLRIGRPDRPFTVEAGLEMASQFGATHYEYRNGTYTEIKNGRSLSSFWHAFVGGGGDATDGTRQNNEGNMLGSWVLRLNYKTKQADYGLYADHFFEDHSAMFHINYDGYEYRDGSMKHGDNRFILYPLKDIMLGADIHLHNCSWLTDAAIEYVYTRYQSGPVYLDHNQLSPDQIGGRDNYYNNHVEPGWQHWGQTLGNPLYISPIYNTDDNLTFQCNRFTAWHLAIAGQPTPSLRYRLRASWQEGLGTYDRPFTNPRRNVSVCAEATYSLGCLKEGLSLGAAFAIDRGCLLGNSTGGRITLSYTLQ